MGEKEKSMKDQWDKGRDGQGGWNYFKSLESFPFKSLGLL